MLDIPNSTAADLDAAKESPAYKAALAKLADREWRLNNLYWIKNEDGEALPFRMNEAQANYFGNRHFRDCIVKARQLGFSTLIEILKLDRAMFVKNTRGAIIDAKIEDAEKKLLMITFAYERLPESVKSLNPMIKANMKFLGFMNGSTIEVSTTARGGTMQFLHVSEYGTISLERPENATKIKTGAFPAVHAGNYIAVESTAHGQTGEFYDLVQRAQKLQESGAPLTALDFKLHFYGWWIKKEYRLNPNMVLIPSTTREYFDKLAPLLLARHGVRIGADQIAWYQKKLEELGPDDMKSEYPSVVEEAFFNSLQGAFWKLELSMARQKKRIGLMVPFDPTYLVNTAWDIGEDCTAVIFHQTDGLRHRIIDYYEDVDGSLQAAAKFVHERGRERGFVYDKHYGPHDLDNRDWAHESKTRKETAEQLGIDFTVVPRVGEKADSIQAVRRMLNMTWIDQEYCGAFVERIEAYRKRWNKSLGVFTADPVHDMASHPSDALQQLAMGLAPAREVRKSSPRPKRPKTTAWSA